MGAGFFDGERKKASLVTSLFPPPSPLSLLTHPTPLPPPRPLFGSVASRARKLRGGRDTHPPIPKKNKTTIMKLSAMSAAERVSLGGTRPVVLDARRLPVRPLVPGRSVVACMVRCLEGGLAGWGGEGGARPAGRNGAAFRAGGMPPPAGWSRRRPNLDGQPPRRHGPISRSRHRTNCWWWCGAGVGGGRLPTREAAAAHAAKKGANAPAAFFFFAARAPTLTLLALLSLSPLVPRPPARPPLTWPPPPLHPPALSAPPPGARPAPRPAPTTPPRPATWACTPRPRATRTRVGSALWRSSTGRPPGRA